MSPHASSVQRPADGSAHLPVPTAILGLVHLPSLAATSHIPARMSSGCAGLISTPVLTAVFDGIAPGPPLPGARTDRSDHGDLAVRAAAAQHGRPYRWGAAGPDAFDAAGLVTFVFRRLGVALPRTVDAQYATVDHLPNAAKRPGDLLFFGGWHGLHHVGVYAGSGLVWQVARSGDVVRPVPLWTSSYLVGRAA